MRGNPPERISAKVMVRKLPILADIGINPDEVGRRQPLIVSVSLELMGDHFEVIDQTVDYRRIVTAIEELAGMHIPLIETFAQRLGTLCLAMGEVRVARIEIDKPFAIARGLAGVYVKVERPPCSQRES